MWTANGVTLALLTVWQWFDGSCGWAFKRNVASELVIVEVAVEFETAVKSNSRKRCEYFTEDTSGENKGAEKPNKGLLKWFANSPKIALPYLSKKIKQFFLLTNSPRKVPCIGKLDQQKHRGDNFRIESTKNMLESNNVWKEKYLLIVDTLEKDFIEVWIFFFFMIVWAAFFNGFFHFNYVFKFWV